MPASVEVALTRGGGLTRGVGRGRMGLGSQGATRPPQVGTDRQGDHAMTTLTTRKPLGGGRAQAKRSPMLLTAWHNGACSFRAAQIREMVEGIEWRTPSGVPFAWIGSNPPAGYDVGGAL